MNPSTLKVRVSRKAQVAQDICAFELASLDGTPLPPFGAGAHIDVHLPGGLVRQYSLCNDPARCDRYEIAVLRDANGRGGSIAAHDRVAEGDVIEISAPRNHFALAPDARHHLLLAGGIGVTPILAMAQHLSATGASFDMHYCTRSAARTAFIERLRGAPFDASVRFHFDDGEPSQCFDIGATLETAPADAHLYVCGPRGFMDAVLSAARARNWPEARLHYEFFGAAVDQSATNAAFKVQIASSGALIDVPANTTVIAALAASGIELVTSCEQGVCGTCLTRVLDGCPDHRDSYLTDEEKAAGDQFLPCCSRSLTPVLVLDL